jgi:hypothetical protein
MNTLSIIFLLSITLSFVIAQPNPNRLLPLDWSDVQNGTSCIDYITDQIKITNDQLPVTDFLIPINDLCLQSGDVISIENFCLNNQNSINISVLKDFFFLDKGLNDSANLDYKKRQCECQLKCNTTRDSPYTFKIQKDDEIQYYTTQNFCIAFCLNGYEIYPTSYIVNTFPKFDVSNESLLKGLDECSMFLDHTIDKFKQITIMQAEFCHALAFCEQFKEIYLLDITEAESLIYNELIDGDSILTNDQKYWIGQDNEHIASFPIRCQHFNVSNNPVNTGTAAEACFDNFSDTNTETFCIKTTYLFSGIDKFDDQDIINICDNSEGKPIGMTTTVNLGLEFTIVNSKIIQCLIGFNQNLVIQSDNVLECVCSNPSSSATKFDTSCIDSFFEINALTSFDDSKNYSSTAINNTSNPNYSFDSTGKCSCDYIGLFDFMNIAESCALCFIDGTSSSFKTLSLEERFFFIQFPHISPPSFITNHTQEECESLQLATNCALEGEICSLKILQGKAFFTKQTKNFSCVLGELDNPVLNSVNFTFDCADTENCSDISCAEEYVNKCEADSLNPICSIVQISSICSECKNMSKILKTCIIDNSNALLSNENESCVRKNCMNHNIKVCKENENCLNIIDEPLNDEENTQCQNLFNNPDCETNCQSKDNVENTFCKFGFELIPDCITEQENCINLCNDIDDRIECSNINSDILTCFQSFCEQSSNPPMSCGCFDCVTDTIVSLEVCKEFNTICDCYNYTEGNLCIKTTDMNDNDTFNLEKYVCLSDLQEIDNVVLCDDCNDSTDCCKQFCTFTESKCIILENENVFQNSEELCSLTCEDKNFIEQPDLKSCCIDLCLNHTETFCLVNDESTILFNNESNCSIECEKLDNNTYELINDIDKCKTCEERCENFNDSITNLCSFDINAQKNCITEKEECIRICNREIVETVICTDNTNEFDCLNVFCTAFVDKTVCNCLECTNSSLDLCKIFIQETPCSCDECSDVSYCEQNSINETVSYRFFTNIECCGNIAPEDSEGNVIQPCATCNNKTDCCHSFCNFTENKCIKKDTEFFFYNPNQLCDSSCDESVSIEIEDTFEVCCKDICQNHSDELCYFANNEYSLFDSGSNCNDLCNNLVNIDDFQITNNISLCTSTMTCEQQSEAKPIGEYCNRDKDIFDSFIDYCNSVNGEFEETDFVYCPNGDCKRKRDCKKAFSIKDCNYSKKQLAVISEDDQCLFFNSEQELMNEYPNGLPDWQIYKCKYSCEDKCKKSIDFFNFYISHVIPDCNEKENLYCYRRRIISSFENKFYINCLKTKHFESIKCNDHSCSNTNCKKSNHQMNLKYKKHSSNKNKFQSIEENFFWTDDMNLHVYYSSRKLSHKMNYKFNDFKKLLRKRKYKNKKNIIKNIKSLILQNYGCYSINGVKVMRLVKKDDCNENKYEKLCAQMNVSNLRECKIKCENQMTLN